MRHPYLYTINEANPDYVIRILTCFSLTLECVYVIYSLYQTVPIMTKKHIPVFSSFLFLKYLLNERKKMLWGQRYIDTCINMDYICSVLRM